MILKFVIICTIIIVLKTLYNLYYFFQAKRYLSEYLDYVKNQKSWFIRENRQKIKKLLEKAGIEDSEQPITEPAGFGMVRSSSFSIFKNLAVLNRDIVEIISHDLREAVNVYKSRIVESFNPIYWVEFFFLLPKNLLIYLGFQAGGFFIKLIQLIWWILGTISILVGIFFNKEFMSWLEKLI